MASSRNLSKTTVRRFLLITLSHCEARNVSNKEVVKREKRVFTCTSILVSQEPHKSGGSNYHVGVKIDNSSKKSYARLGRFSGVRGHAIRCSGLSTSLRLL